MNMAFRLTKEQRIAAVKHFYKCNDNAAAAARRLSEEFDIHEVQGRNIKNIVLKFEETGSVSDLPRSGRSCSATTDVKGDELMLSLERSPQKSSRRLASELMVSPSSVLRLLHQKNLIPYIPRLFHALHDGDADRRLQFAETFLQLVHEDAAFIDNVWWSDEASFKLNGHINRHNCVYWADENPHKIVEKEVNLPGVTVWAAISSSGLIGPIFFEGTVTSENYLVMLQTHFWPKMRGNPNCYFQQDGAPPHYGLAVRRWLDDNFRGRWIGRRGAIEWPARSPDITPPDFFLWGILKDMVYREKPRTLQDLRTIIEEKFAQIDTELCKKVCRSVPGRLARCIEMNGEHFER